MLESDGLWEKLHAFHIFPHVENFQGWGMTSPACFPPQQCSHACVVEGPMGGEAHLSPPRLWHGSEGIICVGIPQRV